MPDRDHYICIRFLDILPLHTLGPSLLTHVQFATLASSMYLYPVCLCTPLHTSLFLLYTNSSPHILYSTNSLLSTFSLPLHNFMPSHPSYFCNPSFFHKSSLSLTNLLHPSPPPFLPLSLSICKSPQILPLPHQPALPLSTSSHLPHLKVSAPEPRSMVKRTCARASVRAMKSPVPSDLWPSYSSTPSVDAARNTTSTSSQDSTEPPSAGNTRWEEPLNDGTCR